MRLWRMTPFSKASHVETILDKKSCILEELLDEDEIIQECKALNTRLVNYLQDRAQVQQLVSYIVEEAPADAENKRIFKFPFITCEIFACEVDVILKTLAEDDGLMNLLFSFIKPDHPHSLLLAGYFSKVVICLMLRKTVSLINYLQGHQEIFCQLVDLIGITSIMGVLMCLVGAEENMCSNYVDAVEWLKDTELLEMIIDKFSSSILELEASLMFSIHSTTNKQDSPQVHANAAQILCAITRYAPPGLAAKVCSPSFVGRLFHHALEGSRPMSVLVHSLSVCISLLDPKRLVSASYKLFRSQLTHGSLVAANPETVDGMLESLGDLLKMLDVSSAENALPTTYGNLHPPLGKHRLKIVEFISVLLTIGSEAAEKRLVQQGAIKRILDLFFEYPFNNFLHHCVENIIVSCLESRNTLLIEHLLQDCSIVGRILGAEKHPLLLADCEKPTTAAKGRSPPRIGNIGHLTRIANKLIQSGNVDCIIQTHLQENNKWVDWHENVLLKRNAVGNVCQWACGRPNALLNRTRDRDNEHFQQRDCDRVTSNLCEAPQYGIYKNEDITEDVCIVDESAEAEISSPHSGDDAASSSLFINSNWFALDEGRATDDCSTDSMASGSLSLDRTDEIIVREYDVLAGTTSSELSNLNINSGEPERGLILVNGFVKELEGTTHPSLLNDGERSSEWVEWTETMDANRSPSLNPTPAATNSELKADKNEHAFDETSVRMDAVDSGKDPDGC